VRSNYIGHNLNYFLLFNVLSVVEIPNFCSVCVSALYVDTRKWSTKF